MAIAAQGNEVVHTVCAALRARDNMMHLNVGGAIAKRAAVKVALVDCFAGFLCDVCVHC